MAAAAEVDADPLNRKGSAEAAPRMSATVPATAMTASRIVTSWPPGT